VILTASRRCSVAAQKPISLWDITTAYPRALAGKYIKKGVKGNHELTPISEKI
jgi:hypothetical protein